MFESLKKKFSRTSEKLEEELIEEAEAEDNLQEESGSKFSFFSFGKKKEEETEDENLLPEAEESVEEKVEEEKKSSFWSRNKDEDESSEEEVEEEKKSHFWSRSKRMRMNLLKGKLKKKLKRRRNLTSGAEARMRMNLLKRKLKTKLKRRRNLTSGAETKIKMNLIKISLPTVKPKEEYSHLFVKKPSRKNTLMTFSLNWKWNCFREMLQWKFQPKLLKA